MAVVGQRVQAKVDALVEFQVLLARLLANKRNAFAGDILLLHGTAVLHDVLLVHFDAADRESAVRGASSRSRHQECQVGVRSE